MRGPVQVVPQVGVEPTRSCEHGILSPACLPVPSLRPQLYGVNIPHLRKSYDVQAVPPQRHMRTEIIIPYRTSVHFISIRLLQAGYKLPFLFLFGYFTSHSV